MIRQYFNLSIAIDVERSDELGLIARKLNPRTGNTSPNSLRTGFEQSKNICSNCNTKNGHCASQCQRSSQRVSWILSSAALMDWSYVWHARPRHGGIYWDRWRWCGVLVEASTQRPQDIRIQTQCSYNMSSERYKVLYYHRLSGVNVSQTIIIN